MFIIFLIVLLAAFIALTAGYFQNQNSRENQNSNLIIKDWWGKRRLKYNLGLIIAGLTAFILYTILGEFLIAPYDTTFQVTLFTIFFQGVGYLFMMLIANLLYYLGPYVDKQYNKNNSNTFRQRLFNFGFWFSISLPFLIPILILIEYLVRYAGHNYSGVILNY